MSTSKAKKRIKSARLREFRDEVLPRLERGYQVLEFSNYHFSIRTKMEGLPLFEFYPTTERLVYSAKCSSATPATQSCTNEALLLVLAHYMETQHNV